MHVINQDNSIHLREIRDITKVTGLLYIAV